MCNQGRKIGSMMGVDCRFTVMAGRGEGRDNAGVSVQDAVLLKARIFKLKFRWKNTRGKQVGLVMVKPQ